MADCLRWARASKYGGETLLCTILPLSLLGGHVGAGFIPARSAGSDGKWLFTGGDSPLPYIVRRPAVGVWPLEIRP